MTPAIRLLTITPMSTQDSTITQGTRGVRYSSSWWEFFHWSARKNECPLKPEWNNCQTNRSSFTSLESRIKEWGFRTPIIKSINLCKKAWPGTTTAQAKLRKPINDWISWWVTLCVQRKVERRSRHLSSFSCGKWAPMRTVTSSMPAKAWVVNGPIVPWLYPENYVTLKKVPYWRWHASFEGEIIKKSSNKCKI